MTWRAGRPVDAATAPSEKGVNSGATTICVSGAVPALPLNIESRAVAFYPEISNSGMVYLGPSGVTVETGFPLFAGGIVFDINQKVNAIYVIGTVEGDGIRWISVI